MSLIQAKTLKLCIFTDIKQLGGVDTFLRTLTQDWLDPPSILNLFINEDYPGSTKELKNTKTPLEVITYKGFTNPRTLFNLISFFSKFAGLEKVLSLFKVLFDYLFLFPFYIVSFTLRFRRLNFDRFMVVNGGYPGSITCLAAVVAWRFSGKNRRAVLNVHSLAAKKLRFLGIFEEILDRIVFSCTDKLITVSNAAAQALNTRSRINLNRIKIIPNGIEDLTKKQILLPDIEIVGEQYCIVLATFDKYKGHSFAIDSFAIVAKKIPNLNLILCGTGTNRQISVVKKQIAEEMLQDRIRLLGFVHQPYGLIQKASVVLVPSQQYESFGLTIIEAMALSRPVVATNVGGIPEIITHNVSGKICEKNDTLSFADAIIELLYSKKKSESFGKAGRRAFLQRFTADKMRQNYMDELICPTRR